MTASEVLTAACDAYRSVPFYRRLYGAPPADPASVPFVEYRDYRSAHGLAECVASLEDVVGLVPAYSRHAPRFPMGIPESAAGWALRRERLHRGLDHLGHVAPETRVLILADDATGPFAADLSGLLAWDRQPASIFYVDAAAPDVAVILEAWAPATVFVVASGLDMASFPAAQPAVFVCPLGDDARCAGACDRLLVSDACHVIGAARRGDARFTPIDAGLVLERDAGAGRLAVTTRHAACLPLVRYVLEHRADFLGV